MENKITPKQALEQLKDTKPSEFVCIGSQCQEEIEVIEQALTEHEKIKKVLENIQTSRNKVKTSLSAIFEGLSQEEKYALIEHIYYSQAPWQEKYQDLQVLYKNQTHNNEMLTEENQELKKVLEVLKPYIKLDESGYKGFPIIHWCDKYQLFALLQSQEECDLLERWLGK